MPDPSCDCPVCDREIVDDSKAVMAEELEDLISECSSAGVEADPEWDFICSSCAANLWKKVEV